MKTIEKIEDLQGEVLVGCERLKTVPGRYKWSEKNEGIKFTLDDGRVFHLTHIQDCCEHVYIEDLNGDLGDLVGVPLLLVHESTSQDAPADFEGKRPDADDSETWTFYRFSTIKGSVVIRFYGTSNGYYSESVDFFEAKELEN